MKRIIGSENFPVHLSFPIITMGNFDGVHLGHQILLTRAQKMAAAKNGGVVAYTFDPHPVRLLVSSAAPPLLQTLEQKLSLFEEYGVEVCVIEPFTESFSHLSAENFFQEIIVKRLHAVGLVVGYDFTFGAKRAGTTSTLERLCQSAGIELCVVQAQFEGEMLLSSSQIRKLVRTGDMELAAKLLGRPFQLVGRVVKGRGLGESLGAHTANLEVDNELVPGDGVYLTTTSVIGEGAAESVTSIGNNPTFPGAPYTIETHLLDQERDLQGKRLAVNFLEWMREQVTFETSDALKQQIADDLGEARARHARRT